MKNTNKALKTLTIALPIEIGKEIQKIAKKERRTINEVIKESVRQYQALHNFAALVKKGKATAKKKKLTEKDFGGPFQE